MMGLLILLVLLAVPVTAAGAPTTTTDPEIVLVEELEREYAVLMTITACHQPAKVECGPAVKPLLARIEAAIDLAAMRSHGKPLWNPEASLRLESLRQKVQHVDAEVNIALAQAEERLAGERALKEAQERAERERREAAERAERERREAAEAREREAQREAHEQEAQRQKAEAGRIAAIRGKGWPADVTEAIIKRIIFPGMSREQVREAWGAPQWIHAVTSQRGTTEWWWYGGGSAVYFIGDAVDSIRQSSPGR